MKAGETVMKQFLWLIILVGIFDIGGAYAQYPETSLQFHGSLSLPTGEYGNMIGDDPKLTRRAGFDFGGEIGMAGTGFGFGAEFVTPTGVTGLGWILNATVIFNHVETGDITDLFTHVYGDTNALSFEFDNWINIPVMTGLRYQYQVLTEIHLFASLQGGINFTDAPDFKATVNGIIAEETTYDRTIDFGFGGSFGIIYQNRYTLEIKYLDLDTPTYEGQRKLSELVFPEIARRITSITGENRNVSMVLITLGINIL